MRALAFCAFGALLAYGVNALLVGSLRRAKVGEYGFRNAIADGDLASDLVVIGSSRAMVHFDCTLLERKLGRSCVNLGLDGLHTIQQVPLLQLYLKHTTPPSVLVIEVDVTSLEVQARPLYRELYLAYASEPAVYEPMVALDRSFWAVRYVPLYGFATSGINGVWDAVANLFGRLQPASTEARVRGYVGRAVPWDGTYDAWKRENPKGALYDIDARAQTALARLIDLGQAAGAKVAIVYSPELNDSHRYLLDETEVIAGIAAVAHAHDVAFFDHSHDSLGDDQTLFYNSQHLNARGARLFTTEISDELATYLGTETH